MDKVKAIFERVKKKVTESPAYKAFLRKKNQLAKAMLAFLLNFFDLISPVCSFLCLKTTNREKAVKSRNKISQVVISHSE